jgi:hypothetical protein
MEHGSRRTEGEADDTERAAEVASASQAQEQLPMGERRQPPSRWRRDASVLVALASVAVALVYNAVQAHDSAR